MKTLHIWLLLLLAVLLPVRGALAAAMPCAGEGIHQSAEHALHEHGDMRGMGDADEHAISTMRAAIHHHEHSGVDKCNLCASCCSATPMLTTFALTVAKLDESAASFAVIQASVPTFLSEGQERPPRSI